VRGGVVGFYSSRKILTLRRMNLWLVCNFVENNSIMKYFVAIAALATLASCSNTAPEVIEIPVTQEEAIPVVANASSKMFVSGMTCVMGCKGAIEKKLNATEGVASFEIAFEDSTAVVQFDSTLISAQQIIATVDGVAGGGLYKATLLAE